MVNLSSNNNDNASILFYSYMYTSSCNNFQFNSIQMEYVPPMNYNEFTCSTKIMNSWSHFLSMESCNESKLLSSSPPNQQLEVKKTTQFSKRKIGES